mmetsp:Transcript_10959/g.9859  ORF Transcript_10959/g.9859 Transcript_10959/m.9859 type:complete len:223 (-) Transcript_10959:219-887(-)
MIGNDARNRGASYMMDAYEAQYENNSGEYEDNYNQNEYTQLVGCAKCSKHAIFGINFFMLLIGVGLIVVSFLSNSELNILGFDPIEDYMKYIIISFGVLIVIQSFLGCSGATTQTKCIIIIYIILLIISLCLFITIIIYLSLKSQNLNHYTLNQWNALSQREQTEYQTNNNCSDYDSCKDNIQDSFQYNLSFITWISVMISVYQIVMISIGCVLTMKLRPSK